MDRIMVFLIFVNALLFNVLAVAFVYAYFLVKALRTEIGYMKENMNKLEKRVFEEEVFRIKHRLED